MTVLAEDLYYPVLVAHSLWRWVVVALLTAAVSTAFLQRAAQGTARVAVLAADIQLTLGIVLYVWLSPLGVPTDPAGSSDSEAAFLGVIHFATMLVALVLIHVAGVMVRRGLDRRGGALFATALVLTLAAIPWWRPLLRI